MVQLTETLGRMYAHANLEAGTPKAVLLFIVCPYSEDTALHYRYFEYSCTSTAVRIYLRTHTLA